MERFCTGTLRANAKRFFTALVITGFAFVVGCGKPGPNHSNYDGLKVGQGEDDVLALLGPPSFSDKTMFGGKMHIYEWWDTGDPKNVIYAEFEGGKLSSRSWGPSHHDRPDTSK